MRYSYLHTNHLSLTLLFRHTAFISELFNTCKELTALQENTLHYSGFDVSSHQTVSICSCSIWIII